MALRTSTVWKLLGLAGVVGVAATGAITLRNERRRRDYSPEEIRSVLHERYARAVAARDGTDEVPLTEVPMNATPRIRRLLRRIRSRR
ncbi:hypothetical protein [Rhodococcus artemisiae]|uniref:Secreted protein n=1 Tax=Rhodococcus artemisiae TaxID=714159 RepID=A0ABU7L479_9NOCA|nr:hypothetical protein [Rhodococcus artemisiae]MEE2056355.1 hypothetical protein [Rhodococcus artemisiae]